MNEQKMRKLFDSARNEPAPAVSVEFGPHVMRAFRREDQPQPVSLFQQLSELFPRLAVAAVLVIGLCVAADFWVSAQDSSDLSSGVARLSEDWLFATKGL